MSSNAFHLTRRGLIAGAAVLATLPGAALALNDAEARRLVAAIVGDINRVIASRRSLSSMISEFEQIFRRHADVEIIARSTLGVDARRATPSQMTAFVAAFRGYIARKYGKRFKEFEGGRLEVKSVRAVKSFHEVICTAYLKGEAPFEISFLVSDKSGSDKFFDMIVEGVSLRLTERSEIGAMLDRRGGDIDAMIADLARAG